MMKRIISFAIVAAFAAAPVFAQMTLIEDFSSYSMGQSLRNTYPEYDANWDGVTVDDSIWHTRNNADWQVPINDPENLLVGQYAGQPVGVISDRDATSLGGELEIAYSAIAMELPTAITSQGTIYMKMKMDDNWNSALCTNGYANSKFGTANASQPNADGLQGFHNWSDQSTITRFEWVGKPEHPDGPYFFDATDGSSYATSTNTVKSETWYEFWIQLNVSGLRAKYYFREMLDGGNPAAPTAMLDAGGSDEWAFRQIFLPQISTLKWNIQPAPVGNCDNSAEGDCIYNEMLVADIGYDPTAMTLDSIGNFDPFAENTCETVNAAVGDFNCDNFVNLTDLVTLGENYNQPGDYTMGDTNMDGQVNLTDLVTLGENYNTEVETPEPVSLCLLLAGSLLVMRRR